MEILKNARYWRALQGDEDGLPADRARTQPGEAASRRDPEDQGCRHRARSLPGGIRGIRNAGWLFPEVRYNPDDFFSRKHEDYVQI